MVQTEITLVILAAGMGSRYGGMKQLDGVGPCGETIMEYSVFDAIRAGVNRIIFVIKAEMEEVFEASITQKIRPFCQVQYAYQRLEDLPEGFHVPENRIKPWGTAHAVRSCRGMVDGPFIVINADDYYGITAFTQLVNQLSKTDWIESQPHYFMLGYHVNLTLSEHGTVARGVCEVNENGYLKRVTERTNIQRKEGAIQFEDEQGNVQVLSETTPVSMNIWGFTPDFFEYLESYFIEFLSDSTHHERNEIYLPSFVQYLIDDGHACVAVLPIEEKWYGVTYREDRAGIVSALAEMTAVGAYPCNLWSKHD